MPTRGPDGRLVREEGLNFNISIFTILKYLIIFAAIFPWYKLIEKTEILKIFDMSCPTLNALHAHALWKIQWEPQQENQIK